MNIPSKKMSRRSMLVGTAAAGGLLTATTLAQAQTDRTIPQAPGRGGTNPGPSNPAADRSEPGLDAPADHRSWHAAEPALLV